MSELESKTTPMTSYRVRVINSNTEFDCDQGQLLLHAMEGRACKAIPVGCRCGGCGLCQIRVLEGRYQSKRMSRAHISEQDEQEGRVLACRIRPDSDLLIACEFDENQGNARNNKNEE